MTGSRHGWTRVGAAAGALLLATGTAWGQSFVYPQKGQTPQRQAQDQSECQAWATQQTGINPGMTMAQAPPPAQAPQGGVLRGGARGAAVGAVGGAIGGDAGKGAAIGAATGALVGGVRRREERRSAEAAQAQSADAYNRAYAACLEG